MTASGIAAVGVGAALGAWLRWGLGAAMNALVPALPMGTLAANLIGGYLVGVAVAIFEQYGGLSPELRLFVITGFLGGLTPHLTFSAQSVSLLATGRYRLALAPTLPPLLRSISVAVLRHPSLPVLP